MGYTSGRRHTQESLREIAKQYNTKSEFQKKDPSAYSSARRKGVNFLNSICEHMIKCSYSTPQLICKKILETLLGIKCLYNTRCIIAPYELDIYFPEFKLAIEYNGRGWHNSPDSIRRDNYKKLLCDNKRITLIIIKENNRNYEEDIKSQLIQNLETLNKLSNRCFTDYDVEKINCIDVYDDILRIKDIEEIKKKIADCSSIKEFKERYVSEYNFLFRNKKTELLECIRKIKIYTNDELLEKCKKISNYSDLVKNHSNILGMCRKRGLLKKATAHMLRKRTPYINHTNQDLMNLGNTFKNKSHIKRENTQLYLELIKRDILKILNYVPNIIRKSRKEEVLQECLKESKKYNNFEDFKKNENLYKLCIKYKILNVIKNTFPEENLNEIILIESKKYKNFKEFSESIWYRKTKNITGLIQTIKKENNWSYTRKENINYVERFPSVVEMINNNVELKEINKKTLVNKTTIWRVKKQMYELGILKVEYKPKIR